MLGRLPLAAERERAIRTTLVGLLVDIGEPKSARAEFDRVAARGPLTVELELRQAQLLRLERRYPEALAAVQTLLERDNNSPRALMLRGTLQLDLGHSQPARDDLQRLVQLEPKNKEAHYKLAQALLRLGDSAEAKKHLQISEQLTQEAIRSLGGASPSPAKEPEQKE
jgi:Flp pilus assembly protein TadD